MQRLNVFIIAVFTVTAILVYQQSRINVLTERLEEFAATPAEPAKLALSPEVQQMNEGNLRVEIQLCHAELARTKGDVKDREGDVKDRERDIESNTKKMDEMRNQLLRIARIAGEE